MAGMFIVRRARLPARSEYRVDRTLAHRWFPMDNRVAFPAICRLTCDYEPREGGRVQGGTPHSSTPSRQQLASAPLMNVESGLVNLAGLHRYAEPSSDGSPSLARMHARGRESGTGDRHPAATAPGEPLPRLPLKLHEIDPQAQGRPRCAPPPHDNDRPEGPTRGLQIVRAQLAILHTTTLIAQSHPQVRQRSGSFKKPSKT